MSILQHPAIKAVGAILAAVTDTLIGGPLRIAMKFRPIWAMVLFAAIVYGILGIAIHHLLGPPGIAGACALLAICCLMSN